MTDPGLEKIVYDLMVPYLTMFLNTRTGAMLDQPFGEETIPIGNSGNGLRNPFDPRAGSAPFRMDRLPVQIAVFEPLRTNYFSVYVLESGSGTFWADSAQHEFQAGQLLFFVPYQYCRFVPEQPIQATRILFHANFLCVETFHVETGCSGVLFNDHYGQPIVTLDAETKKDIADFLKQMQREQDQQALASQDALLAYMKLLLITATRLKLGSQPESRPTAADYRHPILVPLRELIEQNYQRLHSPADYAALLHMTPKALGRCVKESLGKTLTDLIRERVMAHAKWHLLHTLKPVKQVASELGFRDELYFSRLFKKSTGVSPTYFREFETEIRNGSNLSMP